MSKVVPGIGVVLLGLSLAVGNSHADVFSNIPEAADYEIAYELAIPVNGAFQGATLVPYTVNNSATFIPGSFDRVAYYLELTNASGTTWAYASMDAFTALAAQTGIPHDTTNPISFQQNVSNLSVFSNVPGVKNGSFDRGQIEMWHSTYTAPNANAVFAASETKYDWGDTIGGTPSGYGSFQIHNPGTKQVVLSYNRWAIGDATNDDVGIGNSAGTHPDWTLAANTATYTARKLVVLLRPKRFNVTFTAKPVNQQVTPRNTTTNLATVPISGSESSGGFETTVLKTLRNGVAYGADVEQALDYSGGSASFSFAPEIPAELATYTFELYLKQGADLRLVRRFSGITAGDVFLWYGQSNAEAAAYSGTASPYSSPWIRTFGMSSDDSAKTQAYNFWVEAEGDGSREIPAGVGQWPLVVGRKIVDTYGIPVAILNGARAGYSIPQLQRDDANPDNLTDIGTTRPYNRLRYRAIQAKVANNIRGIFFYQGESDANDADLHTAGFAALMQDWQTDYPSVERVFVTQIHVGCGSIADRNLPALHNAQRLFPDVYEKVRIMSTNGLTTHTDNCHFPFTGGYETHGLNTFPQVQRELYGAPDTPVIDPPNPARVEIANDAADLVRIVLRKPGAGITVDPASLADFRLNGSSANLVSANVTANAIELQYDSPVSGATGLDYLAHTGSGGGWVRNSAGIGLLAFTEPLVSNSPEINLISPTGVTELTPGSQFSLSASASSTSDTIVRMEIHIDGILHTAVNGSNSIAANWTVPASGAHSILFRAADSETRVVEESVVIFTEATTAPGGVSSGLKVWLRPENGITRDASGAISAWLDSSGNGNGCVQATTAAKPTYQSNQFGAMPGAYFDGGDWLTGGAGMSTGSYTKIVRVRMPDFTSPSGNILSSSAPSGTRHALFMSGSPNPRMWHNGLFATSNTAMVANTGYLIVATYDSTNKSGTLYLNGTQVGSGTATANTTDASYQLGNLSSGNFTMRGAIGEAIIYDRVINSTERANIESYLNGKAAIPPLAPRLDYPSWSTTNVPLGEDATPNGDANKNGIPNLIEFALGFETTGSRQPLAFSVDGGMVNVSYSRPTDRTGITYQLLESPDLASWSPVSDSGGVADAGIETRVFARTLVQPGKLFYRLQVILPP